MGFGAEIWVLGLAFVLEAGIWASNMRFDLKGGIRGSRPGGAGEKQEKFPHV